MSQLADRHAVRGAGPEAFALPGAAALIAGSTWIAAVVVEVAGVFGRSSGPVADIFGVIAAFAAAWMLIHSAYGSPDLRRGLTLAGGSLFVLGATDALASLVSRTEPRPLLTVPYVLSSVGFVLGIVLLALGHARRRDPLPLALALTLVALVAAVAGSLWSEISSGTIDRDWTLTAALVGGLAAASARPMPRSVAMIAWPRDLAEPVRPTGVSTGGGGSRMRRAWPTEDELIQAIRADRLVVHYQPVLDMRDGRVVGAEALVRLVAPGGGLVTAEEFLPLAHSLGLMPAVTRTVLDTACSDFAAGAAAAQGWWVAINLGEDEIADPTVCRRIDLATTRSGLSPHRLVIEVNERALPGMQTRHALIDIAGLGVRIALDDFGSGWSSFAQLWSLPLDMVKLDRELVADARTGSATLLRPVVGLARELDLEVLAEGVEDVGQITPLRESGCHLGQGFVWGRAVPMTDFVTRWSTRRPAALLDYRSMIN